MSKGGYRENSGRKKSPEPIVLIQTDITKLHIETTVLASIAARMGPNRSKFAREAILEKLERTDIL